MQTLFQRQLKSETIDFYPQISKNIPVQIAISADGKILIIDIDDIVSLKANGNYTVIHLTDGSSILTSITLKRYVDKLRYNSFIRVHNNCLVNKEEIASFIINDSCLVMKNGQTVSVTRSRKKALTSYFKTLFV